MSPKDDIPSQHPGMSSLCSLTEKVQECRQRMTSLFGIQGCHPYATRLCIPVDFTNEGIHQIMPEKQGPQGDMEISVDITKMGKRKGDEVVQLYFKDLVS